ncbi:hypothetical protein IMG5_097940 [Ichthyophthirius multifiliis]|uniref:Mitochondrial cardiolipin hydrolase n=1 Tax=Ichthyophthirius multifiliis TaxID=5932 RepID=G0QRV6_ICHMU|nr:hypothetical protein IMG5_097940 [Ichthyophthirius multifiliis]EGR32047.1 hypothetical protein IMG5_097940 [Ichthyophthirius multifiliis]|eukprot:XP_004035533.1 hypothetical protein IMG5_097940 [Ichthyophthirius multifiliis]
MKILQKKLSKKHFKQMIIIKYAQIISNKSFQKNKVIQTMIVQQIYQIYQKMVLMMIKLNCININCFIIFYNNRVKSALLQVLDVCTQKKPLYIDALFFPNEDESKVQYYLNLATQSIDICVFILSNDYLAWTIYDLHKKGIKIRIISDDEQLKSYGSDIQDLSNAGIPCRTDQNKVAHMHHKFCIIDKCILMNGSFNWTSQAVDQNQENLTIIESQELSEKYQEQYDKLWESFEAQQLTSDGNDPFLTRKRPTWREKQKKKQNNEKNDEGKKQQPKKFYYHKNK